MAHSALDSLWRRNKLNFRYILFQNGSNLWRNIISAFIRFKEDTLKNEPE